MCNVDINNKVVIPVVVNHDLSPKSCRKRTVGQVHSHISLGQVLSVHNTLSPPTSEAGVRSP